MTSCDYKTRFPWPIVMTYAGLLLAGSLITLSLAPFNLWPAAILALMIYQLTLNNATRRQVVARSLFFGLCLYLFGVHWIYVSMHEHGGASALLASVMTFVFCGFLSAILIVPFALLYHYCRSGPCGKTLGFAACWFLHEWTATWIGTGFPWLFIGYSQTNSLLSGWAPVVGTLGISFILALTAGLLASSAQYYRQRYYQGILVITIIIWIAGPLLCNINWVTKKSPDPITVALVQPNYTLEQKWDPDNLIPTRHYYRDLIPALKGAAIIVWPETAITEIYQDIPEYIADLNQLAKKQNSTVIFGIPTVWSKHDRIIFYNSIIAVGNGTGMHHKQKLVPFGEYVPFENQLRGLIHFFDLPLSTFSSGPDNQALLTANGFRIAPYICYEIVYPDFVSKTARSADLLLTVSNDTWFGRSIGPQQHMQMAQMRALENGRYLLRDTNDGITAVVDNKGRIIKQLEPFQQAVLKAKVYAMKGLTPLAHYGTLPPLIFSTLIVLFLVGRKKVLSNP